jgi:hypothetical protein
LANIADTGVGIVQIYVEATNNDNILSMYTVLGFYVAYFPIYVSLNTLLTLMIITRLIWHRRQVREAIGSSRGLIGPYRIVIAILVESYALYALALLMYAIPMTTGDLTLSFTCATFPAPVQVRIACLFPSAYEANTLSFDGTCSSSPHIS